VQLEAEIGWIHRRRANLHSGEDDDERVDSIVQEDDDDDDEEVPAIVELNLQVPVV
jgi:hypothetical protein